MLLVSKLLVGALLVGTVCLAACTIGGRRAESREGPASVGSRPFGRTQAGAPATLYELYAGGAAVVRLTDYGATVVSLEVPDRDGILADVVLGFDDVLGYQSSANQFFGCTTGRVANRIRNGRFTVDGREYSLEINNPPNHLHGGSRGLHTHLWHAESSTASGEARVRFTRKSPDGESGYPGRLALVVTYTLNSRDELIIDYEGRTDTPTPVNLTNHSYFDLAGAGAATILDHEIEIAASRFTPTDDTLIPTGELAPVAGSALDFREPRTIGSRLAEVDRVPWIGYDHNYVLDGPLEGSVPDAPGRYLRFACRLRHPESGRTLEIYTTQPGLQFYSGNFLHGQTGKGGARYEQRSALCLEPQDFPDAVNQPAFPSVVLKPGQIWRHRALYRFSAH